MQRQQSDFEPITLESWRFDTWDQKHKVHVNFHTFPRLHAETTVHNVICSSRVSECLEPGPRLICSTAIYVKDRHLSAWQGPHVETSQCTCWSRRFHAQKLIGGEMPRQRELLKAKRHRPKTSFRGCSFGSPFQKPQLTMPIPQDWPGKQKEKHPGRWIRLSSMMVAEIDFSHIRSNESEAFEVTSFNAQRSLDFRWSLSFNIRECLLWDILVIPYEAQNCRKGCKSSGLHIPKWMQPPSSLEPLVVHQHLTPMTFYGSRPLLKSNWNFISQTHWARLGVPMRALVLVSCRAGPRPLVWPFVAQCGRSKIPGSENFLFAVGCLILLKMPEFSPLWQSLVWVGLIAFAQSEKTLPKMNPKTDLPKHWSSFLILGGFQSKCQLEVE